MVTTSKSRRCATVCVWAAMAEVSLARKCSCGPMPRTSGLPRRAPTMIAGLVLVNGHEAVSAGDLAQGFHHRHLEPVFGLGVERFEVESDEAGEDLGVGLRLEGDAFS